MEAMIGSYKITKLEIIQKDYKVEREQKEGMKGNNVATL